MRTVSGSDRIISQVGLLVCKKPSRSDFYRLKKIPVNQEKG